MSAWTAVRDAFRTEFGHSQKEVRRNPWPRCPDCWHRQPGLCVGCGLCPGCCPKCQQCGECALLCPGHHDEEAAG